MINLHELKAIDVNTYKRKLATIGDRHIIASYDCVDTVNIYLRTKKGPILSARRVGSKHFLHWAMI